MYASLYSTLLTEAVDKYFCVLVQSADTVQCDTLIV